MLILPLVYLALILFVSYKWAKLPVFLGESQTENLVSISVLIAARNEAENIGFLLEKIAQQNFPKNQLEVIVIDDHSTDATADIVQKTAKKYANILTIKYLYLENGQGKKAAITAGVAFAKHELIVTTDADCMPISNDWLLHFALYYNKKNAQMIAAPVVFYKEKNALGRFQTADFVAMMAVTAAGITSRTMLMCNGANLAYRCTTFWEVNGFEGNMDKASGDDMFLMHKIAERYPKDIYFLKSQQAIVQTEPKHTWQDFMAQRLRWGTKNTAYKDWRITAVLGIVWLYSISFFIFTIFFVLGAIFDDTSLLWYLCINIILKMSIDFLLLKQISRFFYRKDLLLVKNFVPSFFIYLYYMLTVGVLSLSQKKYEWKGRNVT
jgi:glycosyltransferase involved in cell wall biosynthesis